jgi:fucose 4-O-acetylase-like acetyltransferase
VLDAARAVALLLVITGHSLAWDVSAGSPTNVLGLRPGLVWLTWVFQILPLFFAAGAVANAGSWQRQPTVAGFLRRRMQRLATPALVYALPWTVILLIVAIWVPDAADVGRFLAQLVWFLGVYCAVVFAVPLTHRWTRRPVLTFALWGAVVIAVDIVRWNVAESVGWANLLFVWGLMHQIGYHLPRLRQAPRWLLATGAALALGAALTLALAGPYSSSLVSYDGDPERSNLAPPTLVLALHGVALILLLAAVWSPVERFLATDRRFVVIGGIGARGMELYLWHIPFVAITAGIAWLTGFPAQPLSALWWVTHVVGLAAIGTCAWLVAIPAGRASRALLTWADRGTVTNQGTASGTQRGWPIIVASVLLAIVLLNISTTGFGTWWGAGMLGLPSSSLLNAALLAGAWLVIGGGRNRQPPGRTSPDS